MKKKLSIILIISLVISSLVGCSSETHSEEHVVANVATMNGPTGMGLVKMIEDEETREEAEFDFTIVNTPDEITPNLVNGNIDIATVPANLASVLHNNTDGEIITLGINTLGVLYVIENGDTVNSIEDLRGKTIYMAGKGTIPEYTANYVLEGNGIDPVNDVNIEFKSEQTEVLSSILQDKDGIAIMPQPFVTTALTNSEDLRIALDITEEWEALNTGSEDIGSAVTGVIVARKEFVEEYPEKVAYFLEEYQKSVDFTNENIDEAAELIGEYGIVAAEVAKKAIPQCNITLITGSEMQEMLSGYLEVLYNANPESVGGSMPSEDFYYVQEN